MEPKSSDFLQGIDGEVLAHIDSRDAVAGQDWKDYEPLRFFIMNIERKARGISWVLENGWERQRQEGLQDAVLDLLGYAYLLYYRVKHL